MTDIVVGLDLGSSSIKATAYDANGRQVGRGRVPTPISAGPAGTDFPVIDVVSAARKALRLAGAGNLVLAVGLASMGELGAVVGKDGTLATSSFPAWYDNRGQDVVDRLGLAFPDGNGDTGGHLRATSTLAKLSWLDSQGEPLEGTFLGLCGLLAQQWTGQLWQEASLATTSGAFNPVTGTWLPALWFGAGLGRVALPPIAEPGRGIIARQPAAREDGIEGALIVIAGHDHPVAAVGTGCPVGSVVDSMGTGEPLLAAWVGPTPSPAEARLLVASGFTIEVWPSTGSPMLIWEGLRPGLAMETFVAGAGLPRSALESRVSGGATTLFSPAECRALESGDRQPLLNRGLDQASPRTLQRAWRDLLDTYADAASAGEHVLRAATGAQGPLILTGGGARSRGWREAKLRHSRGLVEVSEIPETGTRGAAAIAGVSVNWWPNSSAMPLT